jgi:hypothetical protein
MNNIYQMDNKMAGEIYYTGFVLFHVLLHVGIILHMVSFYLHQNKNKYYDFINSKHFNMWPAKNKKKTGYNCFQEKVDFTIVL